MKKALVCGVSGQDGAYIARLLLEKGYEVYGGSRDSQMSMFKNLSSLGIKNDINLLSINLNDFRSTLQSIIKIKPDEIYNLAAQSHVAVSFEMPEYTANADALGALRLLEAIRGLGAHSQCRFYQASTSEMFGLVSETPQTERTPFHPRSPYGVAKLYAHWITVNYRESYGIFASSGILFNHESPVRGETFVTRKVTRGLARIQAGLQDCLYLGNLDARRDWGHARDYVRCMWLMLQRDTPEGHQHPRQGEQRQLAHPLLPGMPAAG